MELPVKPSMQVPSSVSAALTHVQMLLIWKAMSPRPLAPSLPISFTDRSSSSTESSMFSTQSRMAAASQGLILVAPAINFPVAADMEWALSRLTDIIAQRIDPGWEQQAWAGWNIYAQATEHGVVGDGELELSHGPMAYLRDGATTLIALDLIAENGVFTDIRMRLVI
ncbi:hypothetical protein Taro_045481 [Colocasia esculenta]|uniref:Uncharacterized protein n=1 Tax=Colocasia esculenta TaxID=4460 RepID=A0A843X2V3_COLES|nr:hypothetical protein [Colocasia esculenta]